MDKSVRRLAIKQYFKYFSFWFGALAVFAVIAAFFGTVKMLSKDAGAKNGRSNFEAPAERVYDYANVLEDYEENNLRNYIAECENKYSFDIVLVTMNEDVESHGYWETVMMDTADDFYDQNNFGYNKVHGDGALLLDNWYEKDGYSQKGTWLSTCGKVYHNFSDYDIDSVLSRIDARIDESPYKAYMAGIERICELEYKYENAELPIIPWGFVIFFPICFALIFAFIKLRKNPPAKVTTTPRTYVDEAKTKIIVNQDTFLRKHVTQRHIDTSSGSSSGGRSHSGGGGGHVSHGGVSHGGGGHRR